MQNTDHKLTEEDIRRFIQEGESETVEFKTHLHDPAMMARLVAAFANALGGSILIGVQEPGAVVGASIVAVTKVLEEARKHLHPSVSTSVYAVECDGKPVAVVQVPQSGAPVSSDGSFFVRTGAAAKPMRPKELADKLSAAKPPYDIRDLARAISKQTTTIERLEAQIRSTNSIGSKIKDYFVGGIIGAVLGFLLSLLLG